MSDATAQSYYADGPDLRQVVIAALEDAGRPVDPLDPDDLAALDEFHGLGRAATVALADLAGIESGARTLDVGAGIGGPARTLARHFGVEVTALDATPRFCELDEELNGRTGLAEKVKVVRGDARQMPFDDGSFDLVVTQALWQSVEDKAALTSEIARVLADGGRLAIFEVVRGPNAADLAFPVPWGDGPAESFVVAGEEIRELAATAGLETVEWHQGMDAVGLIGGVAGSGRPELAAGVQGVDLSLVMPDHATRMAGLAANVESGRIELVIALFGRAS